MPDPISWSYALPYFLGALLGGYLLGSIPFGLLLTRLTGAGDLRKIGSGNIGATNVLRTGRKGIAALTLLGDAGKGAVAVLIAAHWGPDMVVFAALGAFLGHLFPVWLKFRGGKGVATYLGILIAVAWPGALVFAVVWLAVAFLTRYSSLAALTATVAAVIFLFFFARLQWAELFLVLTALSWAKHWRNIARLASGTESKIGAAS
ncbi:glycerol-3-phosphate 1-O-acyltransferase PlsY [Amorphus orientalis]|uniref:Glycerol-3-phosphate acyltransferase n=1 Tax=Amorphus orientalis TaxID=649198 RepID=A0AAE4AU50_9HYPH|nr:glycerol-3-phosphate 1-O-acyltransferase PlsY [Amorphus orientalis]MDQ0317008.1 glycerol-3-phosphate acyltransferase PlsY [Amorphus orientalis]